MDPDGRSRLFIDGLVFTPCYIRDNNLVGYIKALDILDNKDIITHAGLKTLSESIAEDDNPVIVTVKLKN